MRTVDLIDMEDVIAAYCTDPLKSAVRPLGHGNINATYLVQSSRSTFVLQRISGTVFPDPLGVIENFQKISTHLISRSGRSVSNMTFASPVLTRDGELFYRDKTGDYWRGQSYIPHTHMREPVLDKHVYQVGRVLAAFHSLVADLDIDLLQDPLPDFHNLDHYLTEFDREWALHRPPHDTSTIDYCHTRIKVYRKLSTTFSEAKNNGILELQAIHGDPKVDNFIFDKNGRAFGLLDLDTVGSGLAIIDLGDCLRSCCNTAGERGNRRARFDQDSFKAVLQGYFSWGDNYFSKEQCSLIYDAVLLISFELGLRFFTDYLRGNVYFKVIREDENLLKAVGQFQLADDIKRQESGLRDCSHALALLPQANWRDTENSYFSG